MKKYVLFIPWMIALLATIGSLCFSIFKPPCTLCWYQRLTIFPLSIILGIAAFRQAYKIVSYVLPLTLVGLLVSLYHLGLALFYRFSESCSTCTPSLSSLLFPFLSFLAFLSLNGSLLFIYIKYRRSTKL